MAEDEVVLTRYRRWSIEWKSVVCVTAALFCVFLTGFKQQAYPEVAHAEFRGYPTTASADFTRKPLSPAVAAGIDHYLEETVPIAFAIEENGDFFIWWRCDSHCDYDMDAALMQVIATCEDMRIGSRCYIAYAGSTRSTDLQFMPVMPHRLSRADGTQALGPDEAHGAVIYLPGFNGWNYTYHNAHQRIDDAWVPPLYRALSGLGWDVDVLGINNQHDRSALWRDSEAFQRVVGGAVDELRRKGYRRIVLAGSSRGAAEALLATANGVAPDAMIISEPNDSGGALTREGKEAEEYDKQAGEMIGRLRKANIPKTVLIYFEASFWTSGFAGYLETHPLPETALLVGQPKGFRGHMAEGSERFAGHADCISEYLLGEMGQYQDCRLPTYDRADFRYWQNREQVIDGGLQSLSAEGVAAALSGNTLCSYDWDEQRVRLDWRCMYYGPTFRVKDSASYIDYPYNNYGEIEYVEGGYCSRDGFGPYTDVECIEIFFKDNNVFGVGRREGNASMVVLVPGNQTKTHDVVCSSSSKGTRCGRRKANETAVQAGVRLAQSMR